MGLAQSIKASYSFLKANEYINRYTYVKKDKSMEEAIERYKTCKNKKNSKRIAYEMKSLQKYWDCYPFQYIRYEFYRDDQNFSIEELKDYVPEYFFYRLFLPYHTKKQYEILTHDKNLLQSYLKGLGIKQPVTLAKIYEGILYDENFQKITMREVLERMCGQEDVFIKPIGGNGGHGIQVFSKKNNELVSTKGIILDDKSLKKIIESGNWIIQAGLKQAESISELYPHSINTFRVATENIKGAAKIIYAELRMGRGGARVDNTCQGGVGAVINLETGKFYGKALTEKNEAFETHPDTGYKFADFPNRNWEQIKDFVLKCAEKVPQLTYIGWDVALTDNGPALIEMNVGFGIDGAQPQIAMRELFNINDPKFYWRNQRKNA